MYTDPIADLITRIRNAYMADLTAAVAPHSKEKESILSILKKHGYVSDYSVSDQGNNKKQLDIVIDPTAGDFTFSRVSKPGQRVYSAASDLRPVRNGLGIAIVSTPKGLMIGSEARKANVGGEILIEVW